MMMMGVDWASLGLDLHSEVPSVGQFKANCMQCFLQLGNDQFNPWQNCKTKKIDLKKTFSKVFQFLAAMRGQSCIEI